MGKKKVKGENFNSKLALAIKSGKALFGMKECMKAIRRGESKLVIISNNLPNLNVTEIEYYAFLASSLTYHFKGTNIELGTACGKFHRVAAVAIIDPGDSDILTVTQEWALY